MKYRFFIMVIGCILLAVPSAFGGVITFKPLLSVSMEFTDNNDKTNVHRQKEDSIIITPGFNLALSEKHTGISLYYTPGYAQYRKTERNANWRHYATLSFWKNLSKYTTLKISDSFTRSEQPVYQLDYNVIGYTLVDDLLVPIVDTTLRRGRKEYQSNAVSTSLTHQFGRQDNFSISYLQSSFKELEIEEGNDNKRYSPSLSMSYWITPQSGFDFSAGYTRGVFKNTYDYDSWHGTVSFHHKLTKHFQTYITYDHRIHRSYENTDLDYERYTPSTGIIYKIENDVTLRLGAGYYFRNAENSVNDKGYFSDVSINKSWSFPRGNSHLTGFAGLDRDDFGTERLGLERYYGLGTGVSYNLTKRIRTSINASGRRNEYLDTADDRKDDWAQAGCTLSFIPLRGWFSLSASYTHRLLRSTNKEREYDENLFKINLSIAPNYTLRHVY